MKRFIYVTSILICLFFVFTACSSDKKDVEGSKNAKPNIKFSKCGDFECGDLQVPMNYKKHNGRKLDISVIKSPATDQKNRLGVLLVNPGGPGASGVETVRSSASYIFSKEVLARFDIIGWDPRGSGQSTKVKCSNDLDYLFEVDYSPNTSEEATALKKANRKLGKQCEAADAELLPFLSTENSVRDMDQIRVALGEKQINFLGFSYGSTLGQIYATKYPKNFRTMVIDGVIDIGAEPTSLATDQSIGFESSLNNFFTYCRDKSCSFDGDKDPRTAYLEIMDRVNSSPIKSTEEKNLELGPAQLDIGTSNFLYSGVTGWQSLDAGLAALNQTRPNPTVLLNSFSSYVGRSESGKYDDSYTSFLSIGCADGTIGNESEMFELADSISVEAPIFGKTGILLGLPCATWPNVKEATSFKVDTKGSAPMVIIGTTGDPATPVQWARNAAKQVANNSYLEVDGETHTAYGRGNECVDDLVNKYFLDAKAPTKKNC